MPAELIAILTTLATASVAGIISYWAGLGLKRREWRLQIARERLASREGLYAEFLTLASAHVLLAIEEKADAVSAFRQITEKREHIAMVSSPAVSQAADDLWQAAIEANAVENTADSGFAALKATFIREVRAELSRLEAKA